LPFTCEPSFQNPESFKASGVYLKNAEPFRLKQGAFRTKECYEITKILNLFQILSGGLFASALVFSPTGSSLQPFYFRVSAADKNGRRRLL
jgi:hypothetical protein